MGGVERPATDEPYEEADEMGSVKGLATGRWYYELLSKQPEREQSVV